MKDSQQGFGLVEALITIAVLVFGLLAAMSAFLGATRISEDNRSTILIDAACRNAIEQMSLFAFQSVADEFGPGSGREQFWFGSGAAIVYTDPGDSLGTGTIEVFNVESSIPDTFADLAGGFDLNGNGTIEAGPIDDYEILPVRVSVTIDLTNGPLTVESELILGPW